MGFPAAAQIQSSVHSLLIQRFLARNDPPPTRYRALRRLDAESTKLGAKAWMDAWTDMEPERGFRFNVAAEGGSGFIRSHVLRSWLEAEQDSWGAKNPQRSEVTLDNYVIQDSDTAAGSLASFTVTPRRKDVLLITGSVFVNPEDSDLVRVEGRLSKTPSFMTRRVDVVRTYGRIAGVRVPIVIESVAQVLIAGRSTFRMTYDYESINGQRVGSPEPRSPAAPAR
jgi:hypothetical protein